MKNIESFAIFSNFSNLFSSSSNFMKNIERLLPSRFPLVLIRLNFMKNIESTFMTGTSTDRMTTYNEFHEEY